MKLLNIITGCALALSVLSCDSFLDVHPDAEKLERDLFTDAQGFEDAIYGVYGSLQVTSLYGKDLLWGVPEVLAQNLTSTSTTIERLARYDYTSNDDLRLQLGAIWSSAYTSIGYANNVLDQLNNWSTESLPLYNYYKGEMLAVRALLHFDLVRLFASMDMETEGIPYVTAYSYQVKPFHKVGEVYQFILDDLKAAEALLADDASTVTYPRSDSRYDTFLNYRETHFNLYAVYALLARVYWMKGDLTNAGAYAEKVISSKKFPLVDETEVQDYLAGMLSPKETIFGIYSTGYAETSASYLYRFQSFHSYIPYSTTGLFPYTSLYYYTDVDATSQDARRKHFKEKTTYASFLKLVDYYTIEDNVPDSRSTLISGVTLLHTSEMYLIAAEAFLQTNYDKAFSYFNEEITSRGLTSLNDETTLTLDRIYNEYHKELFGEGQMWFNMKRLNKDIVSNKESRTIPASDKVYVVPIPEEEYNYRNE